MQCPYCESTEMRKNGKRRGKQNHICVKCGRQFIDVYSPAKGYSNQVKLECLKAYVNGMGLRAIEPDKGVDHTTVIYLLKLIGEQLPDAPPTTEIPSVGELDELETFVASKKQILVMDGCKLLSCWRSLWKRSYSGLGFGRS